MILRYKMTFKTFFEKDLFLFYSHSTNFITFTFGKRTMVNNM